MAIDNTIAEKIVSGIKVTVHKKDIKNFHLNVLPPHGEVRVSVPLGTSDDAIQFFIASKISWIKKKIGAFKSQERESKREYIGNESHYFLGKRYLLQIVKDKKNFVEITKKKYLVIHSKNPSSSSLSSSILEKFYRKELRSIITKHIQRYEKQIGVNAHSFTIRKMKTKWGSCNPDNGRLNFNLNLIKKPDKSIKYVIVHELVHLRERSHNKRFVKLLDKHMPEWREERKTLNNLILSYEKWSDI